MSARGVDYGLWAFWYVSWWVAAFWSSPASARPRRGAGAAHRLLTLAGVVLLFFVPAHPSRRWPPLLTQARWREPDVVAWGLCALTLAGFAFCWWARLHLGKLWSGLVTTKASHHVVETGPYRIVRHPIYTGVIFAALATALLETSLAALAGFALIWIGFWITARTEERFLRQQLGAAAYDGYSRRTPMLVPFWV